MGRDIKLPIPWQENRERCGHDMWGEVLPGIYGRQCKPNFQYVVYSLDSLCEAIEKSGAKVLAIEPSLATDSINFWIEWEEGSARQLPPSFKLNSYWRDLV